MQSYLLPYHVADSGAKIVLMGLKNIISYKAKGIKQTKPIVWNSAGQWVISGGRKDLTDSDATEAAMREFFEETGIDFRLREQLEYYGFHSKIITELFPNSSSPDFSVTYILFEDWEGMARDINKNIAAGKVTDDELHEVAWSRPDAAKKILGLPDISTYAWMQVQDKDARSKLVDADTILKKQMSKPWDWFEIAIDNLP
ncbi:MAG: NUDIX hydrolase [Oscillatoriaceae cyanobacterium Prado104]|jgi:8-oxo-dGTP pyrophosphatase MutT (NUDIX family)|nr:NUDIX hydrolase [Oscillatoriaceae cyanobacterium Prado104]